MKLQITKFVVFLFMYNFIKSHYYEHTIKLFYLIGLNKDRFMYIYSKRTMNSFRIKQL